MFAHGLYVYQPGQPYMWSFEATALTITPLYYIYTFLI